MSRSRTPLLALAFAVVACAGSAEEVVTDLPVYARFSEHEVGFIVEGPYARMIFDNMRTAMTEDLCTGGWSKIDASGFNCTVHPDGETQCSFGYRYETQKITNGPLIC